MWQSYNVEIIRELVLVSDVHLKDMNGLTLLHHLIVMACVESANGHSLLETIAARKDFTPYWNVPDKTGSCPLLT